MQDASVVFAELSAVLHRHSACMSVRTDDVDHFYVERPAVGRGKPTFFGAVQIKKSYVSYHLMPLYEDPSLQTGISDGLRARMQGKSCFNFKTVERQLFEELDALTAVCARGST